MRFVENHIVPRLPLEYVRIAAGKRIRGDADVEVVLVVPALTKLLPTLRAAVIAHDFETWQELLELHDPVEKDACRDDLTQDKFTV